MLGQGQAFGCVAVQLDRLHEPVLCRTNAGQARGGRHEARKAGKRHRECGLRGLQVAACRGAGCPAGRGRTRCSPRPVRPRRARAPSPRWRPAGPRAAPAGRRRGCMRRGRDEGRPCAGRWRAPGHICPAPPARRRQPVDAGDRVVQRERAFADLERAREVMPRQGKRALSDERFDVAVVNLEPASERLLRADVVRGIARLAGQLELGQAEERRVVGVVDAIGRLVGRVRDEQLGVARRSAAGCGPRVSRAVPVSAPRSARLATIADPTTTRPMAKARVR